MKTIQKPYKRRNVEIKSTTKISQEEMGLKWAQRKRDRERRGRNDRTNDENNPLELLKGNVRNGFKCPSKSEKQ